MIVSVIVSTLRCSFRFIPDAVWTEARSDAAGLSLCPHDSHPHFRCLCRHHIHTSFHSLISLIWMVQRCRAVSPDTTSALSVYLTVPSTLVSKLLSLPPWPPRSFPLSLSPSCHPPLHCSRRWTRKVSLGPDFRGQRNQIWSRQAVKFIIAGQVDV